MKVFVLSGPGEVSKREYLFKLRSKFNSDSIKTIDLKKSSVSDLIVESSSTSLFEVGERLVICENAPDTLDLGLLTSSSNTTLVVLAASFKAGSVLEKSSKDKDVQVVKFEAERELSAFPFIDALLERKKSAFVELEKLMQEYGFMYVLTMIYYGLRRNFLPAKSDFIKQKISKQKTINDQKTLKKLYELTLQAEFDIKSGKKEDSLAIFSLVNNIISLRAS